MKRTETVIAALNAWSRELSKPLPLTWRYPRRPSSRPLDAVPAPTWKTLERMDQEAWRKHEPLWFYAEVRFPAERHGLSLSGRQALGFVNGWMPFTLWVDGEELWKEERPWKGTGPIAEPFPMPIEPERIHRLVLCLRATELPNRSLSLNVAVVPAPCQEMGEELDVAAAQLTMAQELARTSAERALVAGAAGRVDSDALREGRWGDVTASLARMERALLPLKSRAKALTLHELGHSHIDMDWMWTWEDTVLCARRDLKAVVDLMDEFPALTFTHSQVPTYDVVRRLDPAVFSRVRRRAAEGRWENAAGTWVEGDLNMADGESLARHMLYAKQWTRQHLGGEARVLWEPDTFGHPGNMPQLARLGEFDAYFHMRCHPEKEVSGNAPCPVRMWTGVDGTSIPALCAVYNGTLSASEVVRRMVLAVRQGLSEGLGVWGIGDHGGGLSRRQIRLLERYRDRPLIPNVRFSTVREFLGTLREARARSSLPLQKGATYSLFEGCFTTHASIKEFNRRCEGRLLAAEALAALAGLDRNDALRGAWTEALFNHFHDIMDGAAVHDTYRDAERRAARSLRAADRVIEEAVRVIVRPSAGGGSLTLVNPLGFERTEPVEADLPSGTACLQDADGSVVPVQKRGRRYVFVAANVPAFGTRTWRIRRTAPRGFAPPAVSVEEEKTYRFFKVETPGLLVRISRLSGAIGSLVVKAMAREFVPYGVPIPLSHTETTHGELAMNVFQVRQEAPNGMSAWLINDILSEESLVRGATVRLIETGPVFARFRIEHAFRASRIVEDVMIYRDVVRIDFACDLDWRERGDGQVGVPQLKVSFASNVTAARARTEGPFVVREIPADGMEMPTQKWADVTGDEGGFALLNDSKYGVDALGGRLRLTLLRNPYGPDPQTDNGRHTVRFALLPHGPTMEGGELIRLGMAFNRPMVARCATRRAGAASPGPRIEGGANVVCTALRRAEYTKGTLLRLFNGGATPERVRLSFGGRRAAVQEVNFLERPVDGGKGCSRSAVTLRFRPFEVKTLRIGGIGGKLA